MVNKYIKFYSAAMKNKIMEFSGKWMKLLINVGLLKVTKGQKDKCHVFSHMQFLAPNLCICVL